MWFLFGILLGWGAVSWVPSPAIEITDAYTTDELSFSAPNSIDLVTTFRRARVCPAVTQRYIWHKVLFRGEMVTQVVALQSQMLPFFAGDGTVILTIRVQGITDPGANWFERSVTEERCPLLPVWAPNWLRSVFTTDRLFRSADIPVTFDEVNDASKR